MKHHITDILIALSLIILSMLMIVKYSDSAEIKEDIAIRCIVGESANQGYKGMLAVANVLRNRGGTAGVYGCKSKLYKTEPKWVLKLAKKAWLESRTNDITHGATHFENIKAFGVPYWAEDMVVTFKHKDHVFYKEQYYMED